MEEFFDSGGPRDPLELIGGATSGAVFVPLPGLVSPQDSLRIDSVSLIRMPLLSWRLLEPNRVVDFYSEFYAAMPRFYLAWPFESQDGEIPDEIELILEAAFSWLDSFLLALRLSAPGILIDPSRLVFHMRTAGINVRPVETGRYRMYTTIMGASDVILPPKRRKLGDREHHYPERLLPTAGPAYELGPDLQPTVEANLGLVKAYRSGTENPGVEIAVRNFSKGHDILLQLSQRLICLFTALETVFGRFEILQEGVGLGRRIAAACTLTGMDSSAVEARVEGELRRVRNALAHGAQGRRQLDYFAAEVFCGEVLRVGLPMLLRMALAGRDRLQEIAALSDGEEAFAPPAALQSALTRLADGDEQIAELLAGL